MKKLPKARRVSTNEFYVLLPRVISRTVTFRLANPKAISVKDPDFTGIKPRNAKKNVTQSE